MVGKLCKSPLVVGYIIIVHTNAISNCATTKIVCQRSDPIASILMLLVYAFSMDSVKYLVSLQAVRRNDFDLDLR